MTRATTRRWLLVGVVLAAGAAAAQDAAEREIGINRGPMDRGWDPTFTREGINRAPAPVSGSGTSNSPLSQGSTGLRPVWQPAQARAEVITIPAGADEGYGGPGQLLEGTMVERDSRNIFLRIPEGAIVPVVYNQLTRIEGPGGKELRTSDLETGQQLFVTVDRWGDKLNLATSVIPQPAPSEGRAEGR